jgi:hypothetical protein
VFFPESSEGRFFFDHSDFIQEAPVVAELGERASRTGEVIL